MSLNQRIAAIGMVAALHAAGCGPSTATGAAAGPAIQPAAGPATILGQPILTVGDALAWHTAHPGAAGSIIVRGWFGQGMSGCGPYRGAIDGLEWDCPFAGLMAQPERLVIRDGNMTMGRQPTGPYLALRSIGGVAWPPGPQGTDARGEPIAPEVTVIGHFNEPRSILCQEAQRPACRDAFIVDGYLDSDGQPAAWVVRGTQVPARQSADDVRAAAVAAHPGRTALATSVTNDGSDPAQADTGADPRLLFMTWPGSGKVGWLVRLVSLGGEAAPTTVLVDDADLTVHELPAWPDWAAQPANGLRGADSVATASAGEAACDDGGALSGGVFVRDTAGGDLYLANTYHHGRQRVLADPAAPLFVRGTGLDTVVTDAAGRPIRQGVLPFVSGCSVDPNDPAAPFVFRRVGM